MTRPSLPIHWSTRALERVSEAVDYLYPSDSIAADSWIGGLFAKVEKLSKMPRMGRMVPEIKREATREVFYAQDRIIYRIEAHRIEILTLRHMRQRFDEGDLGQDAP